MSPAPCPLTGNLKQKTGLVPIRPQIEKTRCAQTVFNLRTGTGPVFCKFPFAGKVAGDKAPPSGALVFGWREAGERRAAGLFARKERRVISGGFSLKRGSDQ